MIKLVATNQADKQDLKYQCYDQIYVIAVMRMLLSK